jgi:hypothetical protein
MDSYVLLSCLLDHEYLTVRAVSCCVCVFVCLSPY